MATTWEDVSKAVETALKASISYAKITIVHSISDYLLSNTAQSLFDAKDIAILLSAPEGDAQIVEPMLSGYFRKRYEVHIVILSKADPQSLPRLQGFGAKKGIFEVQADVISALEHRNLSGLVDNKAGANFEVGWRQLALENKGFTAYETTYTVVKTEK